MHQHDQALIEITSDLKRAVVEMTAAYAGLPAVIDREHAAIRTSRFDDVQACCAEKEAVGARIEAAFAVMTAAAARLGVCLEARGRTGERPASLRDCVAALKALVENVPPAEVFSGQILRHQIDGLARLHQEFERIYQDVKPRIEANKLVTAEMIRSYQESYRFWQEVTEESVTPYDQKGQRKVQGRQSGFVARG